MRTVSFVCQITPDNITPDNITPDNMTCVFLTTLSVLTILPSGHFYEYRIANVTGCPKNQSEVIIASGKLGCGQDKYGNNQYMCLPNKEKSFLVELCYDGVMGIQERGICLEIFEGNLIQHSCKYFSDGCPEEDFYDYELFKYPSCQDINTKFHCYVSDPNCPPKQHTGEQSNQYTGVYVIIIFGFLLATIVGFFIIYLWRTRKRIANRTMRSNLDEMDALTKDKEGEIRLVLLGGPETGKTATGNTILGRNCFSVSTSGSSQTKDCSKQLSNRLGSNLAIVDTPGILNRSKTDKLSEEEIYKCISLTSPGPHVFIVVLDKTSFQQSFQETLKHCVEYFGKDMYKYVIILFTKGDKNETPINDFIKACPPKFIKDVKKCGRRVIEFDNQLRRDEKDGKVGQLLDLIKEVIKKNDGGCYTMKPE
nr:GTPase IMAP family member 5-like isoform X3 [Crassostrea gigas]